jgi:predicted kinase
MPKPLLIIVSGPPCTGKTYLAKSLSKTLGITSIHKDDIKEMLFDDLGWSDRAWSRKLGGASFDLLYYFLERFMVSDQPVIVEGNFPADTHSKRILELLTTHTYSCIQILCHADGQIVLERFRQRAHSGERHPGHVDRSNEEEFKTELLIGSYAPLKVPGKVVPVDTSDFDKVNYQQLFSDIKKLV